MKTSSSVAFSEMPLPVDTSSYSVSEISNLLKRSIENNFSHLRIRGEISGYNGPHSSGHAYFSLKDSRSRLEAVIWKGTLKSLRFQPEEGMEMIASGKLTIYPGSSKYQIIIESLEPAGAGALMALLEERKRRLQEEGLFNPDRKKNLPFMPRVIGVISSPTGAVIRDIIHRIQDRFPLHILLWPVRVQGESAKSEIVRAITGFNSSLNEGGSIPRPDILIIARGGGSVEDLWVFNDEELVRTIATSSIPTISAIGHETDWTLSDLVADVRAPTPTAAAEIATPLKIALETSCSILSERFARSLSLYFQMKSVAFKLITLRILSSDSLLTNTRIRLDETINLFYHTLKPKISFFGMRLDTIRLSPSILKRLLVEAFSKIKTIETRNVSSIARAMNNAEEQLQKTGMRLSFELLQRYFNFPRERLLNASLRHHTIFESRIEKEKKLLFHTTRLLDSVSYRSVLSRGFVLVSDRDGHLLKHAVDVSKNTLLRLTFSDGEITANVVDKKLNLDS